MWAQYHLVEKVTESHGLLGTKGVWWFNTAGWQFNYLSLVLEW